MLVAVTNSRAGFTLIELVIGIVLLSIVLTLFTSLIVPQARSSADPLLQLRATELAQSVMREVMARSYDENADRINGVIRCDEDLNEDGLIDNSVVGAEAERACSLVFGPEEGNRSLYDDVDDYDDLIQSGGGIVNSANQNIVVDGANLYEGYQVQVEVDYAGDFYNPANPVRNAKQITVTVTTPTNVEMVFTAFRSNF